MNHKKIIIISVFLVLFFIAAANSQPVCLITDQFWDIALNRELEADKFYSLKNAVFSHIPFLQSESFRLKGKKVKKIVIEAEGKDKDRAAVADAVKNCGESYIILSPLFSAEAGEIAGEYTDKIFVLTGTGSTAGTDNTVKVVYDYKKAFHSAGVWAGTRDEKTHAVFFKDEKLYPDSESSFISGWETVNERKNLNVSSVKDTEVSGNDLLTGYEAFFQGGEGIAAVFAGPYTETVVTGLSDKPVSVVTINSGPWNFAGYSIAASIELGTIRILTEIVNYISIDNYDDPILIEAEFFLYQNGLKKKKI